jgi:ABC-type multidrug transport system ATPase subunit
LEIRRGDDVRTYALGRETTAIGRAADNDLVLADALVSRHHAKLESSGNEYRLVDLGSANGTRVNDTEVEPRVPHPLAQGDTIRIGTFTLTLRQPQEAAPVEPSPPASATLTQTPRNETLVAPVIPRLTVTTPEWTKEFPLERRSVTLGRDPANDIVVEDQVVSRRHAQIRPTAGRFQIADQGSANGLKFDGERVQERNLEEGDVLWIGTTVSLTYRSLPEEIEATPTPQKLDLRNRDEITIGRHPHNNITLDYPTASRNHARIFRRSGRAPYAIEDGGSSNGTFVNGDRVEPGEPRPLSAGDVIRVGPVKFVFAPEALERVDESRDLRLDALRLNKVVGKGLNLLQDISLSIHPREFVAVVGVSGAGKSTLLDALNGFRPATDGSVMVNRTDLYRNFDAYRVDLGYVPQDDIIHRELPVGRALEYAARLRLPSDTSTTERRQRIAEVLDILGLAERSDVPIQNLSGGQRKRVSIGAELLTKPGLFYLDEATSGLDPGTESQMMRLLRGLADQGHTILLVTHATKNVMLCDHVVFLAGGGNLAYYGPPEDALKHFEVEDFDAIYEKLEGESTPEAWADRYRQSPQHKTFITERLQSEYGTVLDSPPRTVDSAASGAPSDGAAATTTPTPSHGSRVSSLRQFWILSSRYLDIIRRDRMNLALLFLIAPALGLIDLVAWPRDVLDLETGKASTAMTMLMMGALIPFLVGALSSVREIVKESAVYRRERTVTLKITPYLLSKVLIGFLFALYHAAALFGMKMLAVDFSNLSAMDMAQFYVTVALAVMSGVMWGLLISSFVPREEQAMLLVIAVVVMQMIFSGGLVPLDQMGIAGEVLGDVTSTKWVYEAITSASHVIGGDCAGPSLANCRLPGIQAFETDAERRVILDPIEESFGGVFGGDVYVSWAALALIIVAMFSIILFLLKRKDVI